MIVLTMFCIKKYKGVRGRAELKANAKDMKGVLDIRRQQL